jgi:hypothetical protein
MLFNVRYQILTVKRKEKTVNKQLVLMSLVLMGSLVATNAQAAGKKQKKSAQVSSSSVGATNTQAPTSVAAPANTSTVNVSDVQSTTEKTEDIDQEITNARMRSELGSKSLWSFKSSLGYSGGSLNKPFDSIRPNYRASATIESLATLAGNVGVNYRVSKGGNLSFGTGVNIADPLHGNVFEGSFTDPRAAKKGASYKRTQVSTPYLDYSHGYRAFNMQMISSATYSHYTEEDATDYYNMLGNVSVSQTALADLGSTKWSGGLSLSFDKDLYKGSFADASADNMRSDLGAGLYPFAEYAFNDNYSFRTVFGYFQFVKYEGSSDLIQLEPYQSMGVGIALSRDIYVYPNVQFTPKDVRADRTNVAVSANLNLF